MMKENFLFLGSSLLSVGVLDSMYTNHIIPKIVITGTDKPVGRNLEISENVVSKWVKEKNIQREKNLEEEIIILKLKSFNDNQEIEKVKNLMEEEKIKLGLVASYGKILPIQFLNLFKYGILNIHPSGLPLYRGPSPLETQVLDGLDEISVCVMQLSEKMDEGDIWYKEIAKLDLEKENMNIDLLEYEIGLFGGSIFSKVINKILDNEIEKIEQDHSLATYTKKYTKPDGDLTELIYAIKDLNLKINSDKSKIENNNLAILKLPSPLSLELHNLMHKLYRKYIALSPWPGIYFTHKYFSKNVDVSSEKFMKVKINNIKVSKETAEIEIMTLTPESKKQISLKDFENAFGKVF